MASGAVTYFLAFVLGLTGNERRWRTMPWTVAAFGIVVVLLGIAGVVLVMLQPVIVGIRVARVLAGRITLRSHERLSPSISRSGGPSAMLRGLGTSWGL